MSQRTITLTGRPPIKIEDDDWDCIAQASYSEHDGQVECQANRTSKWWVKVRQHDDGRAIVYAGYDYTSNWQGARNYAARQGDLLDGKPTAIDICRAIEDITARIANCEHDGDDSARWATLAYECIADMPAEELA